MKTIDEAKVFLDKTFKRFKGSDFYVAGGAITNYLMTGKNKSDFDVYFTSQQAFDAFHGSYMSSYSNDNGIVIPIDDIEYHLIRKIFPSYEEVIDSFDFVCCCAIWSRDIFHHHDEYFNVLENKQLTVNDFDNLRKDTLFKRVIKYINKGFKLDYKLACRLNDFLCDKTTDRSTGYPTSQIDITDLSPFIMSDTHSIGREIQTPRMTSSTTPRDSLAPYPHATNPYLNMAGESVDEFVARIREGMERTSRITSSVPTWGVEYGSWDYGAPPQPQETTDTEEIPF